MWRQFSNLTWLFLVYYEVSCAGDIENTVAKSTFTVLKKMKMKIVQCPLFYLSTKVTVEKALKEIIMNTFYLIVAQQQSSGPATAKWHRPEFSYKNCRNCFYWSFLTVEIILNSDLNLL